MGSILGLQSMSTAAKGGTAWSVVSDRCGGAAWSMNSNNCHGTSWSLGSNNC